MAKEPPSPREERKKEKKGKKRSDKDGIKKSSSSSKPDKKANKAERKALAAEKALNEIRESEKPEAVRVKSDQEPGDDRKQPPFMKPVGALVPFANPLADEKVAKKVFKGIRKGKACRKLSFGNAPPAPPWSQVLALVSQPFQRGRITLGCPSCSSHLLRKPIRLTLVFLVIAAANRTLKRGVKEVVKALRKSPSSSTRISDATPNSIVVLAADISPMDVISHIPVLCEDHNVPYIYVTSRAELGMAGQTKRPTSVVMVTSVAQGGGAKKKEGEADAKEKEEEWTETYRGLVKVVEKEGRHVRI